MNGETAHLIVWALTWLLLAPSVVFTHDSECSKLELIAEISGDSVLPRSFWRSLFCCFRRNEGTMGHARNGAKSH